MALFSQLFRSRVGAQRQIPSALDDHWYTDYGSGITAITAESAMSVAAVYAAVQLLSRSCASLPLLLYKRRDDDGRERAKGHPLSRILRLRPNRWMTHSTFWKGAVRSVLLTGNFYAHIVRDKLDRVQSLNPIHPSRVTVEQLPDMSVVYEVLLTNGQKRRLPQESILHLRHTTTDGLVGISPIKEAATTFKVAQAIDSHTELTFKNRARPSGVLSHPMVLSKEARDRVVKEFIARVTGANSYGIAVVEEGMSFQPLTMSAEDTQLIDQRRFSVEDIARIFNVPPDFIGDLSRATFSNIEHQSLRYVTYSLIPWLKAFEEELTVSLLDEDEQEEYFIEFLVDGLLRGDLKTRYEAYAIGRNNGWLSANEVRRLENMNPIDHGDVYLIPVNMFPADKIDKLPALQPKEPPKEPKTGQKQQKEEVEDDG